MEYAIISISNNQYMVKPGSKVYALGELGKVGDEIKANALLVKDGDLKIGEPTVDYPITLKVVSIEKTDKVNIFTYKAKSRLRRHNGHRQIQTVLEVVGVTPVKAAAKKTKKTE